MTDTVITLPPFWRHERYGYGFEVSRHHKSKDDSGTAYFGGKTDKELEQLMKQTGFKSVWIKSQDGSGR